MNTAEIVALLGGPTAVARRLGIRTPSVCGWMENGIPEGRLIELAAEIERLSDGRFSRRANWPERYHLIWPELATMDAGQPATAVEGA